MSNDGRIEGVGTIHEFVEKANYNNPTLPKPTPNGVGEAEPAVSILEVSCKTAAPQSRCEIPESPAPASE